MLVFIGILLLIGAAAYGWFYAHRRKLVLETRQGDQMIDANPRANIARWVIVILLVLFALYALLHPDGVSYLFWWLLVALLFLAGALIVAAIALVWAIVIGVAALLVALFGLIFGDASWLDDVNPIWWVIIVLAAAALIAWLVNKPLAFVLGSIVVIMLFAALVTLRHHNPGPDESNPPGSVTTSTVSPPASPSGSSTKTSMSPAPRPTRTVTKTVAPPAIPALLPNLSTFGPSGRQACLPGTTILRALRQQQPGGQDFRPPYTPYEFKVLRANEIGWVSVNTDRPCVRALAHRSGVSAQDLPGYMQGHWHLVVLTHDINVMESHFSPADGHIVWTHVVQLHRDELVWEDNQTGEPTDQYGCGNALRLAQFPTPLSSTPAPAPRPVRTVTKTVVPPASRPTPTSHPRPKPQPQPRPAPRPRPTPSPTIISVRNIDDVPFGGSHPNSCAEIILPSGQSGTVSFSSVHGYGTMSQSTYSLSSGDHSYCPTYYGPADSTKGAEYDQIKVLVIDNTTGKRLVAYSNVFQVNKRPKNGRP